MTAPGLSERTLRICKLYATGKHDIAALARQFGVQRPAIYKALRRGGVLPPYNRREFTPKPLRKPKVEPDESQYTQRDSCFYCGVRGDLGCAHTHLRERHLQAMFAYATLPLNSLQGVQRDQD